MSYRGQHHCQKVSAVDMTLADWSLSLRAAKLDPGVVHVWTAVLGDHVESAQALQAWLSPDELSRAERFVRTLDRDRFLARRVILRLVLGAYVDLAPSKLRFELGRRGKLGLCLSRENEPLQFSLSHSQGLALYAVSRCGPVGVDVEKVNPMPELAAVMAQCLTPGERVQLGRMDVSQQLQAFYRLWTCKEAVLKATGEGIGQGLDRVEVCPIPHQLPTVGATQGEPEAEAWSLWQIAPADGYVGAVAVQGAFASLRCGRTNPETLECRSQM